MEGKAPSPLKSFLISSGSEIDEFFIPMIDNLLCLLPVLESI